MDTRTTELIAIGAAVTANCVPCLRYHVHKAREAGLEDDELRAAIGIGQMVRKGAAWKWDEQARDLLGIEQVERAPEVPGLCGCPQE